MSWKTEWRKIRFGTIGSEPKRRTRWMVVFFVMVIVILGSCGLSVGGLVGTARGSPHRPELLYTYYNNGVNRICVREVVYVAVADWEDGSNLCLSSTTRSNPIWSPVGTTMAFVDVAEHRIGWVDPWWNTNGGRFVPSPLGYYSTVDELAWSPDGKEIAISVGSSYEEERDTSMVFLIDVNSGQASPVGFGGAPTWSPDGKELAYFNGDGHSGIAVFTVQTRNVRQILSSSVLLSGLEWSPDGNLLLYEELTVNAIRIYTVHPDGADDRLLDQIDSVDWSPTWSPDGKEIAFAARGSGIMIMDRDGSHRRQLVGKFSPSKLLWSPDGEWLTVGTWSDGIYSPLKTECQIL